MMKEQPIWKVLSNLRSIAILCVVFAHSAFWVLLARQDLPEFRSNWILSDNFWLVFRDLQTFCVPLFFFLSGHYMASIPKAFKPVLGALKKLLYPYLIWSCLYYGLMWREGAAWPIGTFLLKLLQGDVSVYWFILLLMQYYVVSPWLSMAVKKYPARCLAGGFVLQLLFSAINYYILWAFCKDAQITGNLPGFTRIVYIPNFIFFVIAGMALRHHPKEFKKILKRGYAVAGAVILVTGVVLLAMEVLWLKGLLIKHSSAKTGLVYTVMFVQWKASNLLYSAAMIYMLIFLGRYWKPKLKLVNTLGTCAYSIYLVHAALYLVVYSAITHTYPGILVNVFGFAAFAISLVTMSIILSSLFKKFFPRMYKTFLP